MDGHAHYSLSEGKFVKSVANLLSTSKVEDKVLALSPFVFDGNHLCSIDVCMLSRISIRSTADFRAPEGELNTRTWDETSSSCLKRALF